MLANLQLFLGPLAFVLMTRYLGLILFEAVITSPKNSNLSKSSRTECV